MLKLRWRAMIRGRLAACASVAVLQLLVAWLRVQHCAAADEPSRLPGSGTLVGPGAKQPDDPHDPRIAAAIRELGADDFDTRERAGKFLWSLGDKAAPALREAASSDDPEVARRAKSLLADFSLGLRADTPKQVVDLLKAFREARDGDEKRAMADELSKLGPPGVRVLMELARAEPSDSMRRVLLGDLQSVSRQTAARLIAGGSAEEIDLAGRILDSAAEASGAECEAAARDRAAFLALRGGTEEEIHKLGALVGNAPPWPRVGAAAAGPVDPNAQVAAMRLAYLYRALGNLPAALREANKAGAIGAPRGAGAPAAEGPLTTTLADVIRVESGDWKFLADDLEHRAAVQSSVESLGFLAAYNRLAGNSAALDKWTARLVEYADQNPSDAWDAATALLLNDEAAEAVDVLKRHGNYKEAMAFQGPRLEFGDMLKLLEQARGANASEMPLLRARTAEALHFTGKLKEARAALEAVAHGDEGVLEPVMFASLIESAREAALPADEIDAWCVQGLEAATPHDPGGLDFRPGILEKAGFERTDDALKWWPILRARHAGDDPAATFRQLRMLDENRWPAADLDLFAGEMQAEAGKLPDAGRDERLLLVAQTLAAAGHSETAAQAFDALQRVTGDPASLQKAADFEATRAHWDRAAGLYARVAAAQPEQATPLYLWGWALAQQGTAAANAKQCDEGRQRMAHADLMALGDESARHTLAEAMARHGLSGEVKRERDLIARTGEFGSWELADTLRQSGDDANTAGDFLEAARFWDRSFLANLSTRVTFTEPSANLLIPAMVHHARAVGLFRAGRLDDGLKEAELCFKVCPGDADGQIALVTELQDHGHRLEADVIYKRALALYAKLHDAYPDSGPANNLVAWFQGRCHRDLDQALALAQKAVDIEPVNTGIIDTLAEVHFQRGEYDAAIALVRKCIELEPASKHHRENLDRFTKAKLGKKD